MILEAIFESGRDRLGPIMNDPTGHRLQIILTSIERDQDGGYTLYREDYRSDAREYFYPASVVKFPIAVAALEWIEDRSMEEINPRTTMLTASSRAAQSEVFEDPTAADGRPSIGHYIRKLAVVSDNDASNRLFELVGRDELRQRTQRWGMTESRFTHRLAVRLSAEENRHSNPVRFIDSNGVLLHERPARYGSDFTTGVEPIPLGVGEIVEGERVGTPKDFAGLNHMPLAEVHRLLEAITVPDSIPTEARPRISEANRQLLLEAMRVMPSKSGIAAYEDTGKYPDGFANYFIMGRDAARLPAGITITNKVGRAYGFLTETAHIHDAVHDLAFVLSATLEVNANGIYNDDEYEYDEVGVPFLAELGMLVLEHVRRNRRESGGRLP